MPWMDMGPGSVPGPGTELDKFRDSGALTGRS